MNHDCDGCGEPIREVGKLFKIGYMMLCKECRINHRKGLIGLPLHIKIRRRPKKK